MARRPQKNSGMSIAEVLIALIFVAGIVITANKFIKITQTSQDRDVVRLQAQNIAASVTNIVASSTPAVMLSLVTTAATPLQKNNASWIQLFETPKHFEDIRVEISFAGPAKQSTEPNQTFRTNAPFPTGADIGRYDILIKTTLKFYRDASSTQSESLSWSHTLYHDNVEFKPTSETCVSCGA